jgi:hypothetical protein
VEHHCTYTDIYICCRIAIFWGEGDHAGLKFGSALQGNYAKRYFPHLETGSETIPPESPKFALLKLQLGIVLEYGPVILNKADPGSCHF